jgi:hypothetical protein
MNTSINQFTFNTDQSLWENYGIAVNEPLLITPDGSLVCETPVSKIVHTKDGNFAVKGDKVIGVFENKEHAIMTLINAGYAISKIAGMPFLKAVFNGLPEDSGSEQPLHDYEAEREYNDAEDIQDTNPMRGVWGKGEY